MTALPLITDHTVPAVAAGAGFLTCEQGNLPLTDMDVRATLSGLVAGMTIRQTFRNPHGTPIEASYIFPLPDRAAVTSLTVTIGDRRIVGRLEERQAARDAYDAAIEAGQRAAIVEEERPDVFTTRIGNLAPGEQATIELSLAGAVPCERGEATFRVPLVVAPRYISGAPLEGESVGQGVELDTDSVPDASRISPPVLLPGMPEPVRLTVGVTIDPAGLEVGDVRSSLHAVRVDAAQPGRISVELRPGERLDRDFIVRYRVGGDAPVVSAIAVADGQGDGEGTFVVTVVPPAAAGRPPARDVVLLLDRSGSMGGWKMVAARRAAARIIDSLNGADRFAVMAFDHVVERPRLLGGSSDPLTPATDRNRYHAIEWLARLEARGGTEMFEPLAAAQRALAGARPEGRSACCILVTDGQAGNEDQLVATAAGMRLFTVGIDQAVNAGLLHRLAALGGGHCDLVESEDRLDQVMTSVQRNIGNPVLKDITVRYEGLDVLPGSITPARPADLFAGVPLTISGRFRGRPGGRAMIEVAGGGAPSSGLSAVITPVDNPAATPVWARAHLRDLEDRYAAGMVGIDSERLAAEIVATSLRHQVLCRFTAFVAVDQAGEPVSGDLNRIVQPVESPAGWAAPAGPMRARLAMTAAAGEEPPAPLQVGPVPGYAPRQPPPPPPARQGWTLSGRPVETAPPTVGPAIGIGDGIETGFGIVGLDRYRQRFEDLLGALGSPGIDSSRLADDVRQLAKEVVADGTGLAPVAEALGALADALSVGDAAAAHEAGRRLRAALGWDESGRRRPRRRFWR